MMNRLFSATSILLVLACTPPGATVPAKPAEPFKPMVSLRPLAVSLARGATQMFQAEINYPEGMRYLKQPVAWRVVEAEGGTITAAGLYTAPAATGTFHVQVNREDFPGISATATITVK
jgi:chitinase